MEGTRFFDLVPRPWCKSRLVKRCSSCGLPGPFGTSKTAKDGLKSNCRKCCAEKQAEYRVNNPETWATWAVANAVHLRAKDAARYAANPEGEKARTRAWQLRNPYKYEANNVRSNLRKYGITPEDKQALFDRQGGECAICRNPLKTGRTGMHIDHDHQTGAIRGLLCHLCNVMLGHFIDDPVLLEEAIGYLQRGPVMGLASVTRPPGIGWKSRGTRAGNLWYLYGLTEGKFQELFDRQNGGCAICSEPLGPGNATHVDHDHQTRKVRGLLCRPCNLGLGQSRDSVLILQSAAGYLRLHQAPGVGDHRCSFSTRTSSVRT